MDLDEPPSLGLDLDLGTMDLQDRSHETPMDWQHSVDPAVEANRKRPHSVLNSPIKSTPMRLRDPNSLPFLFSKPESSKKLTLASKFQDMGFTTPRKMAVDLDFSSGIESSDCAADSEATPPQILNPLRKKSSHFRFNSDVHSPRSNTHFGGVLSRGTHHDNKPFTTAVAKKVHRRRKEELRRELVRRGAFGPEDSASEHETSMPASTRHPSASHNSPAPSHSPSLSLPARFFDYLHSRPHLPQLLLGLTQFLTNLLFIAFLFYLLYSAYATIQSDITNKALENAADMLAENAVCAREFRANACDAAAGRVPAMDSICDSWEKCFRRDPLLAGRARMGAQTFAEIFNAFVEPISLKTMIFGPAVFLVSWLVLNAFLAGARRWNVTVGEFVPHHQQQHPAQLGLAMGPQHQQQMYGALHPSGQYGYAPTLPPYASSPAKHEQLGFHQGFHQSMGLGYGIQAPDDQAVASAWAPPGVAYTPRSRGPSAENRPLLGKHSATMPAKMPTRGDCGGGDSESPRKIGWR